MYIGLRDADGKVTGTYYEFHFTLSVLLRRTGSTRRPNAATVFRNGAFIGVALVRNAVGGRDRGKTSCHRFATHLIAVTRRPPTAKTLRWPPFDVSY